MLTIINIIKWNERKWNITIKKLWNTIKLIKVILCQTKLFDWPLSKGRYTMIILQSFGNFVEGVSKNIARLLIKYQR